MCGVMPALITQWRNLPVPYAVSAASHNEHPDHQLRIDRGPPDVAVERCQLLAKIDQYPRDDRQLLRATSAHSG
jgi:hypothetical protein